MVNGLLDTSIIVDLLRNYEVAEYWLQQQQTIGITHVVWLEILDGVRDKVGQQRALRLLRDFELVESTSEDFAWATEQLILRRLSHNVDSMDCLIAAPAYRLALPLYTQNLKHFAPILGHLAQKPY